jgi:hypothetical protein
VPIGQLLRSHGFFNPETTKSLTAAFDTAWRILKTSGSTLAADYQSASTRELLANRIIEMASQGERDPLRLVDDALAHLAKSNWGTTESREASARSRAPP